MTLLKGHAGQGPRMAFSLLELVAVIAILALLTGLLLAAVQKVRASAAKARCQNQIRQLGLALHQFHDANHVFPPGVSSESPKEPFPFMSWSTRLLPYLEQQALWEAAVKAYQLDRNFLNNPPHTCLNTPVIHFACPSDERVRLVLSISKDCSQRALTSYLGVNGYDARRGDGVLFLDSHISLSDVTDGTSNTLAVGERPPSADFVFGWWYAGWGQDKDGEADMVLGARTSFRTTFGRRCDDPGPFFFQDGRFDNQCDAFHFWSPHPGGANFLLCDGSVRFIRYSANSILPALASRAGGETDSVPD